MARETKNRTNARVPSSGDNLGDGIRIERLKEAVQAAGGPGEVAKRSGVPLSTLGGYLAGGNMMVANAMAIADAAEVRLEWLLRGIGPRSLKAEGMEEDAGGFAGEARADVVHIPRYEARASAGIGSTLDPGWAVEKVPFSADFIRNKLRRNPAHLALIECAGDSMEPTLFHGDDLLVDTSSIEPRNGIYIVRVNGALFAKRLQLRMDAAVMLLSDNSKYEPEIIMPSDGVPLDVVGEVVWRSGTLRG